MSFKFDLQLFADATMHAKDVISAKMAKCYLIQGTERKLLLMAKSLTASVEKEKVEVPILGRMTKGHKTTSLNITGNLVVYQNTPLFTDMIKQIKDGGADVYFDLMVVNEDPTSDAGRQIITLKDCNIDGADIALFDADGDWNEQSIDFTCEDFEVIERFNELAGM